VATLVLRQGTVSTVPQRAARKLSSRQSVAPFATRRGICFSLSSARHPELARPWRGTRFFGPLWKDVGIFDDNRYAEKFYYGTAARHRD
jgi:hypothetical protein